MKGVTRKERIINAMLEGDASACCGVSREERNLAAVAKAACNGALGGGGGGWDAVIKLADGRYTSDPATVTIEGMTWDEVWEAMANGTVPHVVVFDDCYYGVEYKAVYPASMAFTKVTAGNRMLYVYFTWGAETRLITVQESNGTLAVTNISENG